MKTTVSESNLIMKRIANRLGRPFGVNPFPRAFDNPLAETTGTPSELFAEIFRQNYWGSGQSRSGVGSEDAFTRRYRTGLAELVRKHHLSRLFDAPCGDLNWMFHLIQDSGIQYSGGDISVPVVEDVNLRHPAINVQVFDVTSDQFPDADVWHCRDCFFHLPFAAIERALANFSESTIPYVLMTSHRARLLHKNLDIGFGGFRFLDLERPPVSLPSPIARIPDYRWGSDFPRYVCLWSRDQIIQSLRTAKAPYS